MPTHLRFATFLVVAACGGTPPTPIPPTPSPQAPPIAVAPAVPVRKQFPLAANGAPPMALVIAGNCVVWTDMAGAIFTMPLTGGPPLEIANQKDHGFAFHPVVAGEAVFATTKRDLFRIAMPSGPVTAIHAALPEDPEGAVGDADAIYVTLFKRTEVMRVPLDGTAAKKLFELPRGILAVHAGTLYAASYATGVLVAAPTTGGAPKQLAKGLDHPTALAVDDTYAFIYTERDKRLHRITLATGADQILASDLENADDLALSDDAVYTYSWGVRRRVVRIPKTGGEAAVLASDAKTPRSLVVAGPYLWFTDRDSNAIVRLPR